MLSRRKYPYNLFAHRSACPNQHSLHGLPQPLPNAGIRRLGVPSLSQRPGHGSHGPRRLRGLRYALSLWTWTKTASKA